MSALNQTSFFYGLISCNSDSIALCAVLHISLLFIILVTIVGNLLVIISIIHFTQLHSPTNSLILSLAVADLLIGLVIFPLNMPFSLKMCVKMISVFCKIRFAVDFMVSVSSILNLCCISIDRYYAVCHPLVYRSKITDHMVRMMIIMTWLLALLCGVLVLTVVSYFTNCTDFCFILLCSLAFVTFCTPSVALICVYWLIYVVSQRQACNILNATAKSGGVPSRREKKATKTLAIVMGLFLICWMPLFFVYPFQMLSTVVVNLLEPLNWFALSNSMYNPFIYAFFYKWFRSAFRMIISGQILKNSLKHTKLY